MDGTSALDKYDDFGQWLANIRKLKDPATTPAGFVPATQYLALDENEHLVGMTNLRHHLNDYLRPTVATSVTASAPRSGRTATPARCSV